MAFIQNIIQKHTTFLPFTRMARCLNIWHKLKSSLIQPEELTRGERRRRFDFII